MNQDSDHAALMAQNLMTVFAENRPVGIPETVPFFKHIEEGLKVRPCFVSMTDEKSWPHPKMQKANIVIELLVRDGDATEPEAREWLDALVEAMPRLVLGAVPDLVKLRWIQKGPVESGPAPEGFFLRAQWGVCLVVS